MLLHPFEAKKITDALPVLDASSYEFKFANDRRTWRVDLLSVDQLEQALCERLAPEFLLEAKRVEQRLAHDRHEDHHRFNPFSYQVELTKGKYMQVARMEPDQLRQALCRLLDSQKLQPVQAQIGSPLFASAGEIRSTIVNTPPADGKSFKP